MSAFAIEQNIPIPEVSYMKNSKYPWNELKVDDSFFVPSDNGRTRARVLSATAVASMRLGPDKQFAARTVEGGVRVWRTK